jgi:hypothetical protein
MKKLPTPLAYTGRQFANELIKQIRQSLPVSGQANSAASLGCIFAQYPEDLKARVVQLRWLLDRSTAAGSHDEFLWTGLEGQLAPIAELLSSGMSLLERWPYLKRTAFAKAFHRLLRQKLLKLTPYKAPHWGQKVLDIAFCLIDDRVLVALQKGAYALGMPEARRKVVERDPRMEERDRTIYEATCAKKSLGEIRGLVRKEYPDMQVSDSRLCQIASEYAKRHRLRKPPPRYQRLR